jgi:hypothetical protein
LDSHIYPPKPHAATGWFDQPQDASADSCLAATTFADEPERLSFLNREAHAIHRLNRTDHVAQESLSHRKVRLEIFHVHQRDCS